MNFQEDVPITMRTMGEITFALVYLLKKQDITCVASCTKRIVEEVNGKKYRNFTTVDSENIDYLCGVLFKFSVKICNKFHFAIRNQLKYNDL